MMREGIWLFGELTAVYDWLDDEQKGARTTINKFI